MPVETYLNQEVLGLLFCLCKILPEPVFCLVDLPGIELGVQHSIQEDLCSLRDIGLHTVDTVRHLQNVKRNTTSATLNN